MRVDNIKLNIEGDTYVIPGEDDNPSLIMKRRAGDWNDFELMADTGQSEEEYVPPKHVDTKKFKAALARAKAIHVREGILAAAFGR